MRSNETNFYRLQNFDHNSLIRIESWQSMKNDIEKYQKIKELIIESFKSILDSMSPEIRTVVQDKINKLDQTEAIFEYKELENFLKLAQTFSETLLNSIDNKEVFNYSVSFKILNYLNKMMHWNEEKNYHESDLDTIGVDFVLNLISFKLRIQQNNWAE